MRAKDSGGQERAEAAGAIADGAPKTSGPEPVVDNEGWRDMGYPAPGDGLWDDNWGAA